MKDKVKIYIAKYYKHAIIAIVAFAIGSAGGPSTEELDAANDTIREYEGELTELADNLSVTEGELSEANAEIETLQAKVDEAAPWYKLTEAEKKAKELEAEEKEKENARKEQEAIEAEEKAQKEAEEKAEQERIEASTKTLSTGEYTVGKNIDPGTYNCEAISGNGNFFVYGTYGSLKVNEMFGVKGDWYTKTYNNLELNYGDTITITSGLQIKFKPAN